MKAVPERNMRDLKDTVGRVIGDTEGDTDGSTKDNLSPNVTPSSRNRLVSTKVERTISKDVLEGLTDVTENSQKVIDDTISETVKMIYKGETEYRRENHVDTTVIADELVDTVNSLNFWNRIDLTLNYVDNTGQFNSQFNSHATNSHEIKTVKEMSPGNSHTMDQLECTVT